MIRVLSDDALAALVWSVVCFAAGVAYAAYRAVSWVDRMRSWAGVPTTRQRAYLAGVAAADREWALMLENGMVGPGLPYHPTRRLDV